MSNTVFEPDEYSRILNEVIQKITTMNAQNDTSILFSILDMLNIQYKIGENNNSTHWECNPYSAKILIIGESATSKNHLVGMLKDLKFSNDSIRKRFDFVLDYESVKHYNFDKLSKYEYAVILAGPMPHSGIGKENSSSILTNLERNKDEFYPPVKRLTANSTLKITKNNIESALRELISTGSLIAN